MLLITKSCCDNLRQSLIWKHFLVLDFNFSSGFDPNVIVSEHPIETVADRIWDMRLPSEIHDFIQKKLIELGYTPKTKKNSHVIENYQIMDLVIINIRNLVKREKMF